MVIRARENIFGAWAFLIGVVLAIVVGGFTQTKINPVVVLILLALGFIVGLFVAQKDSGTFLLAAVSLVLVSYVGISSIVLNAALLGIDVWRFISASLGSLIILLVPATIVVAIKTMFAIAQS